MRTFKSAQKSAKKGAFTNKSAQKSTLKGTFGSSAPIWDWPPPKIHVRREQKKTLTRPKIQPKNTACPLLEERESRRENQV